MTVTLQRDLEPDECDRMVQSLGTIATVFHFPPECLCIETIAKFGPAIEREGSVNIWAMNICVRYFRLFSRSRTAFRLRNLVQQKSLLWLVGNHPAGGLLVALEKAFVKAGLKIEDNIRTSDGVWKLIEFACDEL